MPSLERAQDGLFPAARRAEAALGSAGALRIVFARIAFAPACETRAPFADGNHAIACSVGDPDRKRRRAIAGRTSSSHRGNGRQHGRSFAAQEIRKEASVGKPGTHKTVAIDTLQLGQLDHERVEEPKIPIVEFTRRDLPPWKRAVSRPRKPAAQADRSDDHGIGPHLRQPGRGQQVPGIAPPAVPEKHHRRWTGLPRSRSDFHLDASASAGHLYRKRGTARIQRALEGGSHPRPPRRGRTRTHDPESRDEPTAPSPLPSIRLHRRRLAFRLPVFRSRK